MDQQVLERVRRFAESGTPGVALSLVEARELFTDDFDPDSITQALGGVWELCECGGSECPGVRIKGKNGRTLVLPTLAAAAELREMTPVEYIDSLLAESQRVIDRAVELYEMLEDADDSDDINFDAEDQEVLELLVEIRTHMVSRTVLSKIGDIAHMMADL